MQSENSFNFFKAKNEVHVFGPVQIPKKTVFKVFQKQSSISKELITGT
jgi:hypothetical protein